MMNGGAFGDPKVREELKITTIDRDTPVYIEIYRRLRRLIKRNVLKYGEQLPGELYLSEIMAVGRTSLRTALTILYEDGYIKTLRGKGSYVAYDGRQDKFRRKNPVGIVLPAQRISLLGELSKDAPTIMSTDEKDEFLEEKLGAKEGDRICLFKRLYRLNGAAAISANFYNLDSLIENDETDTADDIEEKITNEIKRRAVVAECEMMSVPIGFINSQEHSPGFSGDNHVLVTTTYVDENNRVIAFCKDYYNEAVIRFRTSFKQK